MGTYSTVAKWSDHWNDPECLVNDLLHGLIELDLWIVKVLVDKLKCCLICPSKVVFVGFHELGHCKLSVQQANCDFCVDNLSNKVVQWLVKVILVFACDDLDVLDKVWEVQADEVNSRVALDPLFDKIGKKVS